jgi:hypothetical protein
VKFEADLWGAINRYAISVGGDPASDVYGNSTRMQAVAAVGEIVDSVAARQQIDDLVVEDLVKGSNGAAAAACVRGAEIDRLRAALIYIRGFLLGAAQRPDRQGLAKDLIDEAAMIAGVLAKVKESP